MNQPLKSLERSFLFLTFCALTATGFTSSLPTWIEAPGARAVGMGGAFTGVADDLSALWLNPAGLADLLDAQWSLVHENDSHSDFRETTGLLLPVRGGTLGFAVGGVKYPASGNVIPYDIEGTAAFGFALDKRWSLGASSQWVRQLNSSSVDTSLFWNIGLLTKPSKSISFGFSLQNAGIGDGVYADSAALAVGGAYHLALNTDDTSHLLLSTGFRLSFEGTSRSNAGFELGLGNKYFVRAGYARDIQGSTAEWQRGLSLGAGIQFNRVHIDYAYRSEGNLGYIHTVELTTFFQSSPRAEENTAQAAPTTVYLQEPVKTSVGNDITQGPSGIKTAPTATSSDADKQVGSDAVPTSDDKKPVMLKFKIDSQDDLPSAKLFELAEGKLKLGLKKEAMELYSKVVQKDPKFKKAWARLAELYKEQSADSYKQLQELNQPK